MKTAKFFSISYKTSKQIGLVTTRRGANNVGGRADSAWRRAENAWGRAENVGGGARIARGGANSA